MVTIEEAYKSYLKQCAKHISWLRGCNAEFKRFTLYLSSDKQKYNNAWIKRLRTIEYTLGLTEEEKQNHKLESK